MKTVEESMHTVRDFYAFLDKIAPFCTQEPWDNSGFQVGDLCRPVSRLGVTLDCCGEVIEQAVSLELDLLVSHHPVLFGEQKQFPASSPAYRLAQAGIAAISAHTNLDQAEGGVNDVLCAAMGLCVPRTLHIPDCTHALLRGGTLARPLTPAELAALVAKQLGGQPRFCAGRAETITTVAVCGGAGGDFCKAVAALGVDAYITGEVNHHDFFDAQEAGLCVVAAGHFESEWPVIPHLARLLKEAFPATTVTVMRQKPPYVCFS